MATPIVAPEYYLAGDAGLVGIFSIPGGWILVHVSLPAETVVCYFHLHHHANAGLFDLSGQRRNGLPAACADPRLLLYFRRGGTCTAERKMGRKKSTRRTRARQVDSPPDIANAIKPTGNRVSLRCS